MSEAVAHVRARSFPDDSRDLTGLELEWLMLGGVGERAGRAQWKASRLGEIVLPGGSALSVEPGGQLELSSQPHTGLAPLCSAVSEDVHALSDGVVNAGGLMCGIGLLPDGPAPQRLSTPRYDAMAEFFAADGPAGSTMMTSTASLQVNIGAGTGKDRETRWRRANMLGPVLAASFANSPLAAGTPTGCASTRLGVWSAIDPSRTTSAWRSGQGCESWPAYVLGARVMLIRRSGAEFVAMPGNLPFGRWLAEGHELGYPTLDDLDYHLTTLFPPVRPKGWLELRFFDALPTPWWKVAAVVVACLLRNADAGARAELAGARFAGSWPLASGPALSHPGMQSAARECFTAAFDALGDAGADQELSDAVAEYAERFVARGRTPADERLDAFHRTGSPLLAEDGHRMVGASR
jgi:glutamate--cysteine ligase